MAINRLGIRGVVGTFYMALEAALADSWANLVSMFVSTDQVQEEYKWLGQTPALRKWVGGRLVKELQEKGVILVNQLFEATLGFDVDELRRDKSPQGAARIRDLGVRVAEHWAKLLTDLIRTNPNAYDGATFFSASHSEGTSGTQKNLLTASEVPALNVTTPTDPTDIEMSKAIRGVVAYMQGLLDDQGEPMNTGGRNYLVLVPNNLWAAAVAATQNPLLASGSGAQTNPIVNMQGYRFTPVANPRLNQSGEDDDFFVFRTDAPAAALIRQEELFETSEDDSEIFKHNRILFGVKALRTVGPAFWQYAAKCTLS